MSELALHGRDHHVYRYKIHTVGDEVTVLFVADQALHIRDEFLAEAVQLNLHGAGRAE